MAYRPAEARAYRAGNIAQPLYNILSYARVSLGMTYALIYQSRPTGLIKPCPSLTTTTKKLK